MQLAHRVRTSAILVGASTTILAALLLTGRQVPTRSAEVPEGTCGDDMVQGLRFSAHLPTAKILAGADAQHVAIAVTAPLATRAVRPPLSVAIVIDRSGSMSGAPIEDARLAATKLLDELAPTDAFSIVTYSSGEQVLVPMTLATPTAKQAARTAIAGIYADGGTCISCGLNDGAAEVERTPIIQSVRRIVLISDGQANEGIRDRDRLAEFARGLAESGTSITSVGVGLEFDELTMQRIADVGRGNYYFVDDAKRLSSMFATEMASLQATVADNVTLTVDEAAGFAVAEAYGYQVTRSHGFVAVAIADLRAGETRKIVLRADVRADAPGPRALSSATLTWRDVTTGQAHQATACIRAHVVDDARAVADSVNQVAASMVEEALTARALEEAVEIHATQGAAAAQRMLEQRMDKVRANHTVAPASLQKMEAATGRARASFETAPAAKAAKASRADAYDLAR